MPHGMDGGEKDIVNTALCQPGHMTMDQLYRVTGLRLGCLLGEAYDLLVGRRREQYIESQLPEEGICHRKELVDHQGKRYTHRFPSGDRCWIITFQQQPWATLVKGDVALNLRGQGDLRFRLPVEPMEAGRAFLGFQCQQGGAVCSTDGEAGRDCEPISKFLAESGHDAGVIGHTALEHNMVSYWFAPNYLVKIISDNGLAQTSCDLCLGGSLCLGRLDGGLDKHCASLSQFHRGLCSKCQAAEVLQRDVHACGLLLNKGAGSGSTDFVHLKVCNLPILKGDVFRILTADLKDGICFGHTLDGSSCLGCNLISHGIRTDEPADPLSSGASDANCQKGNPPKTGADILQALSHRCLRVSGGAKILEVHQFSELIRENQVCAGRTYINAQSAALWWDMAGNRRIRYKNLGIRPQWLTTVQPVFRV